MELHLERLPFDHDHLPSASPASTTTFDRLFDCRDRATLSQRPYWMNYSFTTPNPNIRVESSTPPFHLQPNEYGWQDAWNAGVAPTTPDWQQYRLGAGGPVAPGQRPLKRARSHQRTPSASTVASNGPVSPYTNNTAYPHVATGDFSPNSPAQFSDPASFPQNIPTSQPPLKTDPLFLNVGYVPTAYHAQPHQSFGLDYASTSDFRPSFPPSTRHSISSQGNDSPAANYVSAPEYPDARNMTAPEGDLSPVNGGATDSGTADVKPVNPNVSLFRTESQAYVDELYNPPPTNAAPTSSNKRRSDYLSPHRNLVNERLQTANLARSASPTSAVSRERSPFREGSPLAPTGDWRPSAPAVGTAANMRQQAKQRAAEAEYASHRPNLRREPTKTMSPNDAVLDGNEPDQPSLFQDSIPAGYRPHNGGTENWQPPSFSYQPGSSFGNLTAPSPNQMSTFRSNDGFADQGSSFSWMPLAQNPQNHTQFPSPQFPQSNFTQPKPEFADASPPFPATLASMESSVSENPPVSDQGYSPPQRPADPRAGTGTYTCTYHGCVQRFASHPDLQKHKRDHHRAHQPPPAAPHDASSDAGADDPPGSGSPGSTESPDPDTSGMTSAAILARNSQAGPHKCSRINPSTNKPCNTIFSRPYDLTRHEDTIHNNRKQKVKCPMCREEKSFSRNDALTRHMRVVHPEVDAFGKRGRRE